MINVFLVVILLHCPFMTGRETELRTSYLVSFTNPPPHSILSIAQDMTGSFDSQPAADASQGPGIVEMPEVDDYADNAVQLPNDNPIFALIIGNNEYQASDRFKALLGAVRDADAIEDVLRSSLGLPNTQIISLRNATRKEMLDGFHKLEEITKDSEDPCIIIFYAGHGAQAPRPKGWEEYAADYDKIEMLCPSDLGVMGENEKVVEGIPDRMVSALLSGLAQKRGNNITLILDCCHSAGVNRTSETEGDNISRTLLNPPPITAEANVIPAPLVQDSSDAQPIVRGVRVAPGFGGKYATSHVLLAACGRDKLAYESRETGHGYFTNALIGFLKGKGKKVETETYATLMRGIKMPPWQTPHCMGGNADRPLFNRRGSRSDPSYIPCKAGEAQGPERNGEPVYTLFAGLAEGIVPGEAFDLYKTVPFEGEKASRVPFGAMVATDVGTSITTLRIQCLPGKTKVPKVFYAKRIAWSNAPASIYCEDQELLQSLSRVTKSSVAVKSGRVMPTDLVDDPTKASLMITAEGDEVYLERNIPAISEHVPPRFPSAFKRNAPEEIMRVISAWRHFSYHLQRGGKTEFPQIRMDLHYLEPVDGDWDSEHPEYKPFGENLLADEPALVIVSDEEKDRPLGLTLYNDGDVDVYPYLFYFDPGELTITPWSLVAEGAGEGEVDAPLLSHSQLAVGYGNGGVDPLQFFFEDERRKDIGFFKLFITCSPANFGCLRQDKSPFTLEMRGGAGEEEYDKNSEEEAEAARLQAEEELKKKMYADQWGVKLATLVQVREVKG